MPWLSILMALLTFFSQKRNTPEQKRTAAMTAALVGAGTYAVTHHTEWGREHLGAYDGVAMTTDVGMDKVTDSNGNPINVNPVSPPAGSSAWDVLKAWGPTGTAAVIGTTAVATNSSLNKWLIPLGILAAFLLLK